MYHIMTSPSYIDPIPRVSDHLSPSLGPVTQHLSSQARSNCPLHSTQQLIQSSPVQHSTVYRLTNQSRLFQMRRSPDQRKRLLDRVSVPHPIAHTFSYTAPSCMRTQVPKPLAEQEGEGGSVSLDQLLVPGFDRVGQSNRTLMTR